MKHQHRGSVSKRRQKRYEQAEHKHVSNELDASQQQVEVLNQSLSERFGEISILTRLLEEQTQLISGHERTIDASQRQVEELNQALSERFGEIAILTRLLEEQTKLISEHERTIDGYQRREQIWEAERTKLAQSQADLQQQLITNQQQASRQQTVLEEQVSQLVKQNEELNVNIADRFAELAAMTRHLEHVIRQLQHKDQQLEQAKKRVLKLKKTASWKVTSPIRAIGRVFKNRLVDIPSSVDIVECITASGLFDESWYLHRYPEVANSGLTAIEHFIKLGAVKGYNPSEQFDTRWYLQTYPDVAQDAIYPLLHYIMHGKAEQRRCLPTT